MNTTGGTREFVWLKGPVVSATLVPGGDKEPESPEVINKTAEASEGGLPRGQAL